MISYIVLGTSALFFEYVYKPENVFPELKPNVDVDSSYAKKRDP